MTIERATVDDMPGLCRVHKASWLETYPSEAHGVSREVILSKDFDSVEKVAKRQSELRDPQRSFECWGAKEGGEAVGFWYARQGDATGRIGAIYVLSAYHGRGPGTG